MSCTVIKDTWLLVEGHAKHNWWCRTHRVGWDRCPSETETPPCPLAEVDRLRGALRRAAEMYIDDMCASISVDELVAKMVGND